jgi:hypothetical protein
MGTEHADVEAWKRRYHNALARAEGSRSPLARLFWRWRAKKCARQIELARRRWRDLRRW